MLNRIVKAETLLPLIAAMLLALSLFSCKKDEQPIGKQYGLSPTFMSVTREGFPLGTRWVYRDVATGVRFSMTLNQLDSLYLPAGPGYKGFVYYTYGYRLQTDPSIIPLPQDSIFPDTTFIRDTITPDSIVIRIGAITMDTIQQDTVIGRNWRVLPYEATLAGAILGMKEQAIFFFDSTKNMLEGRTAEGLKYNGQRTVSTSLGDITGAFSFLSDGVEGDSLSATEMDWAPGKGLIRLKTKSGREFLLDSLIK